MSTKKVLQHVDKNMNMLIKDLCVLIRQPSVSAKNQGIKKCASLVKNTLKKSGINAEILSMKDYSPIVYGEVKSKKNPNKTLLFYNHYDVQPVDPVELWDEDPFSGKIKGNKIYGRGSSDDKGELITRIRAVTSFLKVTGDVPCNVKFVIEGEEETGSAHIEEYLKKYRKKFSCDGVIWEFGHVDSKNRPIIDLGMKGLLYVELSLRESKMDAHSSLAVLIKNPAWRLVEAIKTLRDSSGKILIKDWYKEVQPLAKSDIKILTSFPFDEKEFKKEYGIKKFLGNKTGLEVKKSLVAEPTCNIAGIVSGYYGEGAKTVLPAEARVKIDFRLVPKMNPKKQAMRLKRHLVEKGFGDIEIKRAQTWIEDNYAQSISVDFLAEKAGVSSRQFNRRFKVATQETATKYIQLIRVEAAKRLLERTTKPFDEISLSVGYENSSFFRRLFKQVTSKTPMEYRKIFCQFI